ncbi:PilZ domain-containing protein [Bacillus tianshenii]|nr:PilZ domain-containing protein [Bacillus tianshenii]
MFDVGDTLEIMSSLHEDTLSSKVIEIDDENIFIQEPVNIRTNRSAYLGKGTKVQVTYTVPSTGVYQFISEITTAITGIMPMFVIRKPKEDDIIRIQRRNFVRVEAMLDMIVQSENEEEEFEPFKAYTTNISGGGIAVALPFKHPLKEDMDVRLKFELPLENNPNYKLDVLGHVVRISPGRDDHKDRASIEFLKLADIDRRTIVRFTFERQLALRKTKYQ